MGTRADIQNKIADRIGPSAGSSGNWTRKINDAIYWAILEICTVKFNFLFTQGSSFETTAGQTAYSLPSDFHNEHKFFLNAGSGAEELIKGTYEDIVVNPLADRGTPGYYIVAGTSGTVQQVQIGYPSASGAYTVTYSYFKKLSDYSEDSGTSIISSIYRDDPIVQGAIFRCEKILSRREAQNVPESAEQEFLKAMAEMESVVPFTGPTYAEILATRGTSGAAGSPNA